MLMRLHLIVLSMILALLSAPASHIQIVSLIMMGILLLLTNHPLVLVVNRHLISSSLDSVLLSLRNELLQDLKNLLLLFYGSELRKIAEST